MFRERFQIQLCFYIVRGIYVNIYSRFNNKTKGERMGGQKWENNRKKNIDVINMSVFFTTLLIKCYIS